MDHLRSLGTAASQDSSITPVFVDTGSTSNSTEKTNASDSLLAAPLNQIEFDQEFGFLSAKNQRNFTEKVQKIFFAHAKGLRILFCNIFPILQWIPKYNVRENLLNDIIGGFTVGIMNIPQSLAYASLVGLEPINGLYTSFFAAIFYMLFASSRLSSIGVSAVISLMIGRVNIRVSQSLNSEIGIPVVDNVTSTEIPIPSVIKPVDVSTTLTLTVGLIQLAMVLLRLDFLTTYMSEQVIHGFTTGAAVHVLVSQLNKVLGVKLFRYDGFLRLFKTLYELIWEIPHANWATVITSVITLILLYFGKNEIGVRIKKYCRYPIPFDLIVVIIGILLSYFLNVETNYHMTVVGEIPTGLPAPSFPNIYIIPYVITDALAIAIIILAVAVSMGKIFAKKYRYPFNVRQEMYAIGITQCACSFFPCWTASVALARSVISESAGTKTQISAIFSALLTLLVIYVLGPIVRMLPMCFLSCIVIVALRGMLLQLAELNYLWQTSKFDCAIWIVTFSATILFDVIQGLLIGIAFALFTVIMRIQQQEVLILGRLFYNYSSIYYRPLNRYRYAYTMDSIFCLQISRPILFTNADSLKEIFMRSVELFIIRPSNDLPMRISNVSDSHAADEQIVSNSSGSNIIDVGKNTNNSEKLRNVKYILIDMTSVLFIDETGTKTLIELYNEMKRINIFLFFCNTSYNVLQMLCSSQYDGKLSTAIFFPSMEDARKAACLLMSKNHSLVDLKNSDNGQHNEEIFS